MWLVFIPSSKHKSYTPYKNSKIMYTKIQMNILLVFLFFLFSACNINGTQKTQVYEPPKIVFEQVSLLRYEKNKKVFFVTADILERYPTGETFAAKNINIKQYSKGENDTREMLDLIATADQALLLQQKEHYYLSGNVNINNRKEDLQLRTNSLFYNGETNLLVSGQDEPVEISRHNQDTSIRGTNFVANVASWEFMFTDNVTGQSNNESDTTDEQDGE